MAKTRAGWIGCYVRSWWRGGCRWRCMIRARSCWIWQLRWRWVGLRGGHRRSAGSAGLVRLVASDPTVSRLIVRLAADAEQAVAAIRSARAAAREWVWRQAGRRGRPGRSSSKQSSSRWQNAPRSGWAKEALVTSGLPAGLYENSHHRKTSTITRRSTRQEVQLSPEEPGKFLKEIREACRIGAVVFVAGVRSPPGPGRPTSRKETP